MARETHLLGPGWGMAVALNGETLVQTQMLGPRNSVQFQRSKNIVTRPAVIAVRL